MGDFVWEEGGHTQTGRQLTRSSHDSRVNFGSLLCRPQSARGSESPARAAANRDSTLLLVTKRMVKERGKEGERHKKINSEVVTAAPHTDPARVIIFGHNTAEDRGRRMRAHRI